MVRKIDVTVPAEGGIDLGAWLFVPEGAGARAAITMAHGFAGTREHGIELFAQAFAAAGFVVLVHDHRNFGTSGGDLRGDIDPWRQVADWRRAISYLEARPEVDPTRIGLWGTSYAGGHALGWAPQIDVSAVSLRKFRRSAAMSRDCDESRPTLCQRWSTPSTTMSGRSCEERRLADRPL
ncbi:alpha/beta hydrolase [Mesorhizobium opportunistum]|uniref:Alpha/beta hydrolase n=1 Tax=Mesorhizobium opportunistum TaxID=593909 RepID=A0ABV1YK29_9HYPH